MDHGKWSLLLGLHCLVVLIGFDAAAAQVREESFAYDTGQLTSLNGGANVCLGNWVTVSGTGNPMTVSEGSLSYLHYPSSGVGNKLEILSTSSSAEDAYMSFPLRTTGSQVFASLLLSVRTATGLSQSNSLAGNFFAALLPGSNTSDFMARLCIRKGSIASTFQLGVRTSAANAAAAWLERDLPVEQSHLVVLSCQLQAGSANDVGRLWVNPVLSGEEPPPDAIQTSSSSSEPSQLARLALRQDGASTPSASIDGIRIGSAWTDAPLPVQLISFSAQREMDGSVVLRWATITEVNNYGFEVQRSVGTEAFRPLPDAFLQGYGTSLLTHEYRYVDGAPPSGLLRYRLRQIDLTGIDTFSDAVIVPGGLSSIEETGRGEGGQLEVYPNPFHGMTNLTFQVPRQSRVTLKVYDMLGREVATLEDGLLDRGTYVRMFDGTRLPNGVYICRGITMAGALSRRITLMR